MALVRGRDAYDLWGCAQAPHTYLKRHKDTSNTSLVAYPISTTQTKLKSQTRTMLRLGASLPATDFLEAVLHIKFFLEVYKKAIRNSVRARVLVTIIMMGVFERISKVVREWKKRGMNGKTGVWHGI